MIEISRFTEASQGVARERLLRAELPTPGPPKQLPQRLLAGLRMWDKDLEFVWWEPTHTWHLYRVHRSVTPSSDVLIREKNLCGPNGEYREPGPWVLRDLRTEDVCRRYGTLDKDLAARRWVNEVCQGISDNNDAVQEGDLDDMAQGFAEDMLPIAKAAHSGPMSPKPRKKPGVKEIAKAGKKP